MKPSSLGTRSSFVMVDMSKFATLFVRLDMSRAWISCSFLFLLEVFTGECLTLLSLLMKPLLSKLNSMTIGLIWFSFSSSFFFLEEFLEELAPSIGIYTSSKKSFEFYDESLFKEIECSSEAQ